MNKYDPKQKQKSGPFVSIESCITQYLTINVSKQQESTNVLHLQNLSQNATASTVYCTQVRLSQTIQ